MRSELPEIQRLTIGDMILITLVVTSLLPMLYMFGSFPSLYGEDEFGHSMMIAMHKIDRVAVWLTLIIYGTCLIILIVFYIKRQRVID